ncbi:MAG: hypothetical protein MZV70_12985 [Desulfobacterales bacterium]|nr:hypothetical protein [Desulfobacterales bacterium]
MTVLMRKGEPARSAFPPSARRPAGGPHGPGGLAGTRSPGTRPSSTWPAPPSSPGGPTRRSAPSARVASSPRRHLVEAMAPRKGKETHLFSTSGAGYYGYHGDEDLTEESPPGTDFLAMLSRDWEAEALQGDRITAPGSWPCRFGIVMGQQRRDARRGSSLMFRMYLGAGLGSGRQWLSWVHETDLARIFLFLHRGKPRPSTGALNCTAPEPVRNSEFTGDARQGPGGAHLPATRSRFHASTDEGRVRRRHPARASGCFPGGSWAAGFQFHYPTPERVPLTGNPLK